MTFFFGCAREKKDFFGNSHSLGLPLTKALQHPRILSHTFEHPQLFSNASCSVPHTKKYDKLYGFTLIELLTVVSIIVILSAMSCKLVDTVQKQSREARGKISTHWALLVNSFCSLMEFIRNFLLRSLIPTIELKASIQKLQDLQDPRISIMNVLTKSNPAKPFSHDWLA